MIRQLIACVVLMMFFQEGLEAQKSKVKKAIKSYDSDSIFMSIMRNLPRDTNPPPKDVFEMLSFETLDKKIIFNRLFNSFLTDSNGMAIWSGSFSEKMQMLGNESYDGYYHTSLDTVLYFVNTNKVQSAVVVFSTPMIDTVFDGKESVRNSGARSNVPVGLALFEKDGKGWRLLNLNFYLTDCDYAYQRTPTDGNISLLQIGDKWTALYIKSESGRMNTSYGRHQLFSIEPNVLNGFKTTDRLKQIFQYGYEISSNGFSGIKLVAVPQKKEYSLLKLKDEQKVWKTFKYSAARNLIEPINGKR